MAIRSIRSNVDWVQKFERMWLERLEALDPVLDELEQEEDRR
jgi:hypothetical protein